MEADLFSNLESCKKPLTEELRPLSFSELILDEESELFAVHKAWTSGHHSSYILCGPPGSGKTSFARLLYNDYKGPKVQVNAVDVSVTDLRVVLKSAEASYRIHGESTLLFMDEGHRLKTPQQDILLPSLEFGSLMLISATTENPLFRFNRAFLSRVQIIKTKNISRTGLRLLLQKGVRKLGLDWETFDTALVDGLLERSGGDGRRLISDLSNIKALFWSKKGFLDQKASLKYISINLSIGSKKLKIDSLSALIKSMRASDEKASVYYMGLLIALSEDPQVMFRRMMIFASEDVGLANSEASKLIISLWDGFLKIGMPEGVYSLYHACTYLACSPKSRRCFDQKAWTDEIIGCNLEEIKFPKHFQKYSKQTSGKDSNMPEHLVGK